MEIPKKSIHPLFATAAVAVIIACGVAIASMTGLFSKSNPEATVAVSLPPSSSIPIAPSSPTPTPSHTPVSSVAPTSATQAATSITKPRPETVKSHHPTSHKPSYVCENCGTVQGVRRHEQAAESGSGLGAVTGAILGGVLGHQVGGGRGQDVATAAGAIGGALAGNEAEKQLRKITSTEIFIKLDNGIQRTFTIPGQTPWREGDRVRIVDGQLAPH